MALGVLFVVTTDFASTIAWAGNAPTVELSRRTSTCGYTIGFPRDSDELGHSARQVIRDAAAEADRNGAKTMFLSANREREESYDLVTRRGEAIRRELATKNAFAGDVEIPKIHDRRPDTPVGHLYVCRRDVQHESDLEVLPAEPDRQVTFSFWLRYPDRPLRDVRVPLRQLDPPYWLDTPFETESAHSLRLNFGWPGMADRASRFMRECLKDLRNPCHDRIIVTIRSLQQDAEPPPRLSGVRASGLIAVPGHFQGTRFYVLRSWSQRQIILEARTKNGIGVRGWCFWDSPEGQQQVPTVAGLVRQLLDSTCTLTNLPIGGLFVSVEFPGKYLADWEAVHATVAKLVTGYEQTPPDHGRPLER